MTVLSTNSSSEQIRLRDLSHVPTTLPWITWDNGLIYGQCHEDQDGAPFIADVALDHDRAALGITTEEERATAAFICRAANAHADLVGSALMALMALTAVPNFRVCRTDSHSIARLIEEALVKASAR